MRLKRKIHVSKAGEMRARCESKAQGSEATKRYKAESIAGGSKVIRIASVKLEGAKQTRYARAKTEAPLRGHKAI